MFRFMVGALQYATITCPKISLAVNKVCQFMANPLDSHWMAVKCIIRYLKGTMHLGLCGTLALVHRPPPLRAFCDVNWAIDPDDRCSTNGAATYFGPNLIFWRSCKKPVVARSSADAEYRSLAHVSELLWVHTMLTKPGVPFTSSFHLL